MTSEEEAKLAVLKHALRMIAEQPLVYRNPDGEDQAALRMQLIARNALEILGEEVE